jgi:transposase
LFPPSPRDWLPEGHLAFFIADTVAVLDLSAFYASYEGDGRRNQPFDPQMMVTVLLYAYATGTFSSRRIARKLEEDVAYRVLAAGNFPAHRTIADFRQQHLAAFEAVFVQVVQIAQEAGVLRLGAVVVDGTKVKANASKHKAMSYQRMVTRERELREEIAALTAEAEAADAAEDRAKGRTPADGRKSRGSKPFARDFGVPADDAQDNFTDPESRIMKTSAGFDQCYNGQLAVDERSQLIVATGLTHCPADNAQLLPLVDRTHTTLGAPPSEVLADAGYRGEATFVTLETRGITAYISLGHEVRPSKPPNVAHVATQRMAARLASVEGRARYRRRKAIVEPVIGWIKHVLGFRRFSVRGEAKVRGEWNLVCVALNLKRFHRLQMA